MKTFKLAAMAFLFILISCEKEENPGNVDVPVPGENFNFYKSASLYEDAQSSRSEDFSDEFEITGIELKDNILNIAVSYNAGCETNKFDVIWDGYIMETYPRRINMIIKRTADNCDSDGEFKDEILPVDLTELMGLNPIPEDIVFTVSNASKIPGDGNADTVVTITND